ncbi:hypothetical protein BX616_008975, partial [Lobosporangium transversale]
NIKEVPNQAEDLAECLRNVDIVAIMQDLADRLSKLYPFQGYEKLMAPVLAKTIFDIPVGVRFIVGHGANISYGNLMTAGVIHLEQAEYGKYHIRVPYLWLVILVGTSKNSQSKSPLKYWAAFIASEQSISWSGWERFNMGFIALRLYLLPYLEEQSATLERLFAGADFDRKLPLFKFIIPNYLNVAVHQLLETFPDHETAKGVDGMEHTNFLQEFHKLF